MHLSVILLIVVALVSLLQSVLMVWLFLEGRRTLRGLERFADDLADGISPVVENLAEASGNAAAITGTALEHVQSLDTALRGAAKAWTDTADQVQGFLMPNLGRLAGVAAAWRLFRQGMAVYRFLRRK